MSATEIVETFITALQSGDMELAANTMTDDFVLYGWTPQPLDKGIFLAMQGELHAAMPDYAFHLTAVQEEDGRVTGLIQVEGTQTHDLSLPLFGIPLVETSGISVVLPQVQTTFVVTGNQVAEMRVEPVPGGGLTGLLQQLSTELPVSMWLQDIQQLGQNTYEQEVQLRDEPGRWDTESTVVDEDAG